jgi:hypothetical protein
VDPVSGLPYPGLRARWQKECPAVVRSEAWDDDPAGCADLAERGFRPCEARAVKVGDVVAYTVTDPLSGNRVGAVHEATVQVITPGMDEWTVVIDHSGGTTDVDVDDEVWVKVAP